MPEWVGGNRYLTQSQMDNNARIIYGYLYSPSFELNGICAMLGNMVIESNINPNIYEGLIPNNDNGYGLVQWTPATKLIYWCMDKRLNYKDGNSQLERIKYEVSVNAQWGHSWYAHKYGYPSDPPFTLAEFFVSTLDLDTLVNYFVLYYEQPAESNYVKSLSDRQSYAAYYYQLLSGTEPPTPPHPIPPVINKYGGIPFIYFNKNRYKKLF